jgi:hypothetical protein
MQDCKQLVLYLRHKLGKRLEQKYNAYAKGVLEKMQCNGDPE